MSTVRAKLSQGRAGSAHAGGTTGAGGTEGAPVWFVKSNGPPVKISVELDGVTVPLLGVAARMGPCARRRRQASVSVSAGPCLVLRIMVVPPIRARIIGLEAQATAHAGRG